jgi:hypothetical protein
VAAKPWQRRSSGRLLARSLLERAPPGERHESHRPALGAGNKEFAIEGAFGGLLNSAVAAALIVGVFVGIFLALRISDIMLRREWDRLRRARKDVNDRRRELERRLDEWRRLQRSGPRWRDPEG